MSFLLCHDDQSCSVNYATRSFSFLRGKARRSAYSPVRTSCERPPWPSRRPLLPPDRRKRPLPSAGCSISLDLVNFRTVPFDASSAVISPAPETFLPFNTINILPALYPRPRVLPRRLVARLRPFTALKVPSLTRL